MTNDIQPSATALLRARELCEWEQIMWAVLWDTWPDNGPRVRHLCFEVRHDGIISDAPALFATKRQAQAHINRYFEWCRWDQYRKPPHNNRLPRPYRVRVRITIPLEAARDA